MTEYIFIVGSPRSGTTITGEILDSHPLVKTWFVPYFMWEKYFMERSDDTLTESDVSPKIANYVRDSFDYFRRKTGAEYVIDQSPRNSLRIPFIKKIFPEAKFIHVVRESKDAILSINREWKTRMGIYSGIDKRKFFMNRFVSAVGAFRELLGLQPLVKHKIMAFFFELKGFSLLNPEKHYNRMRWDGEVGWGPRIPGWQEIRNKFSLIEFNAYQWSECVSFVTRDLPADSQKAFTLGYENLLDDSVNEIDKMLKFIDKKLKFEDLVEPPELFRSNYNKWQDCLSVEEIKRIAQLIEGK